MSSSWLSLELDPLRELLYRDIGISKCCQFRRLRLRQRPAVDLRATALTLVDSKQRAPTLCPHVPAGSRTRLLRHRQESVVAARRFVRRFLYDDEATLLTTHAVAHVACLGATTRARNRIHRQNILCHCSPSADSSLCISTVSISIVAVSLLRSLRAVCVAA